MFTIDSTIDIDAPLARVRTAITTEAGYRAWWAQDADFDGRQATFRFAVPTEPRTVTFRVDRCDASGIAMTCIAHENNSDWLGTKLAITLGETPTGTRVHLVHSGYPAMNEVYERCDEAWPYFLRSLASYMMTGAGEPYPKAAKADFRMPSSAKRAPRAVADGIGGVIIAVADIDAAPERVFRALTSDEVEKWWAFKGIYRTAKFTSDLRVGGEWTQLVQLEDGNTVVGSGEFAEIDAPRKVVMTRRFDKHPFQGPRETTITYRFERIETGTRVTVRDEGFIGRSEAAYGNAEIWEKVLGWLDAYLGTDRVTQPKAA